ncbi:hypothetical protein RUM43_002067 [Polyplax serrata]|uniref:Uncharacterized protein n=1 Tax=Polyplax serrata TaxID=468196 RepID=A0AAN8P1U1_POLSC
MSYSLSKREIVSEMTIKRSDQCHTFDIQLKIRGTCTGTDRLWAGLNPEFSIKKFSQWANVLKADSVMCEL